MDIDAGLASPAGALVAAVFGAVWGSFFNVVIARVPRGESVVRPASRCLACGKPVRPIDNIPIISFLLLRGRCRSCGAGFSARYPLVEALGALASLAIFWQFVVLAPELPLAVRLARFAAHFLFVGVLIVLSFIDIDTKRLPDVVTLPALPVLFAAGFATGEVPWAERAIGAVGGYLAVRLIADAYYYLRGREGLGLGDGKLLAVIGAVLGWRALPVIIFMASLLGIAVAVPVLLRSRRRAAQPGEASGNSIGASEVPFGPFLAASAFGHLLLAPRLARLAQRILVGE